MGTMTDKLVEAVAEKLCARYGDGTPWNLITKAKQHDWRITARWIIAGIDASETHAVVPTRAMPEMIVSGCGVEEGFTRSNECYLQMLSARPRITP